MPKTEERRRTPVLGIAQDLGNNCFLANVRECNIAYSIVHEQLCFLIFIAYYILLYFFLNCTHNTKIYI